MRKNKPKIFLSSARAPVTLELARVFHKAGYEVFTGETFRPHLCTFSNVVRKNFFLPSPRHSPEKFLSTLVNIFNTHQIDLFIPTCEESLHVARLKPLLEAETKTRVFIDEFKKIESLHNKYEFIKLLEGLRIRVPKTFFIQSLIEAEKIFKAGAPKTLVLKPVYSRFGANTAFIHSENDIKKLDISSDKPWVAQEYLRGQEFCTYSIVIKGELKAHCCYYSDFKAGGSGVNFKYVEDEDILSWVKKLTSQIKFTGQIAFDFIKTENGELFPLECNPRSTSGVHLLVSNKDFIKSFSNEDKVLITPMIKAQGKIGLALIVYGLQGIKGFKDFQNWINIMFKSKDTIFSWTDPLPACLQMIPLVHFIKVAQKNKISITEASTEDIEYSADDSKLRQQ